MEIFLPRVEIRRRLQARLGHAVGNGQAPLIETQFNEFIRAGAHEVYTRCQWTRAQRETFKSIGIDQRFVDYPDGAGPENILALGVWDDPASRFHPLHRRPIGLDQDDEPLVAEGGDPSAARRSRPTQFECKTQIELWPRADQAYELKIDHTVNPELATDAQVSVVDAEAIILYAIAEAFDFQGDQTLAQKKIAQFEQRIDRLCRWQSNLPPIRRGALNRADANRRFHHHGYVPDSGVWPSTMPAP